MASLVACGDDSSGSSDTDAPTSAAPTPTVAPTTTTLLPTTTTTVPIVFTLRYGGLGPLDFGADPATVIAALTEQFGAPSSDVTTDYPTPTGGGYYENAARSFAFKFQVGRLVCWTFGLCLTFGADDSTMPTFMGWRYDTDTAATLSTAEGLTIGSRYSDHPEVTDPPYPCFAGLFGSDNHVEYDAQSRVGDFPALVITYRSDGIPFTEIAGDVEGATPGELPPPDLIIVKQIWAGEVRYSRAGYCG